jgi:hypothetical protein
MTVIQMCQVLYEEPLAVIAKGSEYLTRKMTQ